FVRELMKRGIIIDLDHFSQHARVDAFQAAKDFGNEAAGTSNLDGIDYPTFGVHTTIRGLNASGSPPDVATIRDQLGAGTENDRTAEEFERIRLNGGTVSPAANAGIIRPDANLPPDMVGLGAPKDVNNDCDFSTKSWAAKYLEEMKRMHGKGVTPSTDMNG